MPRQPPDPNYRAALAALRELTQTPPDAGLVTLLIRTAHTSEDAAVYLITTSLRTRAERRAAVIHAAAIAAELAAHRAA